MPTIEEIIKDHEFYDLPESERIKVMRSVDPDFKTLPESEQSKVVLQLESKFKSQQAPPMAQGHKDTTIPDMASSRNQMQQPRRWPISPQAAESLQQNIVNPAARMVLEGGAATAAEMMALPLGPGGMAAAGTGGYMAGKYAADKLLGGKFDPVQDAKMGAMMSMGGQMLAPAYVFAREKGRVVLDAAKRAGERIFTKQGAEIAAGKKLVANTNLGDVYAKNAKEADKVEKEIPGLKFTYGQKTFDPDAIKMERALTKQGSADMNSQRIASNTEAIRDYFQKNFAGEGIDDFVKQANVVRGKIVAQADAAQSVVNKKIIPQKSPEVIGQETLVKLEAGKKAAKAKASALYNKVPGDTKIPIDGMVDDFKAIAKPMDKFEKPDAVPDIIKSVINKVGKKEAALNQAGFTAKTATAQKQPMHTTIADLQGLNSRIKAQIRKSSQNPNADNVYISRLEKARRSVESAIQTAEGSGEAGKALSKANQFFREEVVEKYKHGAVGNVLSRGARGEVSKVPVAQIPGKFFQTGNLSAADDFIKAVGNDAQPIMRDHAAYDLYEKSTDSAGNVVSAKLENWMAKNKSILKKFGIESDFTSIANAQRAADAAKANAAGFEKNAATAVLNSDPETAIKNAIKGKNMGAAANELVSVAKGNPAAKKGIENAFANTIMDDVRTTAFTIAGDPKISHAQLQRIMDKYDPALKVIYKDSPEKLKALRNIRDAYKISIRNATSPTGGGSDTAELQGWWKKLMGMNLLYRPVVIAKGIAQAARALDKNNMEKIMIDALYNPETAERLMDLYFTKRSKIPAIRIEAHAKGVFQDIYQSIIKRQKLSTGAAMTGMAASAEEN